MRELSTSVAAAACVVAYLFPYFYLQGAWWRFVPATVFILALGVLTWGDDAFELFGIRARRKDVVLSAALLVVALPLFRWALDHLVLDASLSASRTLRARSQFHQLFQVLNDELVARAALLTLMLRIWPHTKAVIFVQALAFSVGHRVVYGFDGHEIGWPALMTLFCLGVIANTLFVRFRHIGFGLALHYAWNFWRFNTSYFVDRRYLSEGETFDFIEGNPRIVAVSALAAMTVFGAYVRWARRSSDEPGA